jgi:hypothetical protein
MRTLVFSVILVSLIPFSLYASGRSDPEGLSARVAELEAQVTAMEEILQYVHVETEPINGLSGPHWIIEGANVHIRSGSGFTYDHCGFDDPDYPNCKSLTGLGNLIFGYNDPKVRRPNVPLDPRTGSHNVIIGDLHSFSSFGGLVAGFSNEITGKYASVTGGTDNVASGDFAAVCGGHLNVAGGTAASVGGGERRQAPDEVSWAAGSLFEPN